MHCPGQPAVECTIRRCRPQNIGHIYASGRDRILVLLAPAEYSALLKIHIAVPAELTALLKKRLWPAAEYIPLNTAVLHPGKK